AVKTYANSVRDAAATARALVRCALRSLLDLQERRLVAEAVALDPREPGIDDVANAGNGERRLGDIGCEHQSPSRRRREDPLLLGDRQARVQRHDFDRRRIRPARQRAPQELARLADFALARKKYED